MSFASSPTIQCCAAPIAHELYAVCGGSVYLVDAGWTFTLIGTIPARITPVSMKDNGLCLMIVDGSTAGYAIDLTSLPRTLKTINDPNFLGADRVDYIDTFFILNAPGTNRFYLSLSNITAAMAHSSVAGTAFNALDIVGKTGGADPIASIICVHREAWIIGTRTSEVWVDLGTPDFPLGVLPGAFIDHGCIAKYSIASHDVFPFWLSQDKDGQGIVVRGENYTTKRISTHAIEQQLSTYPTLSDAIGFCYQMQGHIFYALHFPTANVTWACEIASGQWHQWASIDTSGNLNRHRSNCATSAFGLNIVGDYQNGCLYSLDSANYTDNGMPIPRIRTFPHMLGDGRRLSYKSFIADLQSGAIQGTAFTPPILNSSDFNGDFSSADFGKSTPTAPVVSLRWSDTRGASWSDPVRQQFGTSGQYNTSIKWNRLGMARDRVFELSWSIPAETALNGAFVELEECET